MEQFNTIKLDISGQTAYIVLNRPEKRNAINGDMALEIISALQYADSEDNIRVVILSGAGKIFCAGADLEWMGTEAKDKEDYTDLLATLFDSVYRFPKPLIAIVHGKLIGGAIGLAAGADFVLAEKNSGFCFSEVRLGLIPATISPYIIRRIGEFRARQLMSTALLFDASVAFSAGLVDKMGEMEELEAYKDYLCKEISMNAPGATRSCKNLLLKVSGRQPGEEVTRITSALLKETRQGSEAAEGIRAFMEKRRPVWNKQ